VLQYYAKTKLVMQLGTCKFFSPWKAWILIFHCKGYIFGGVLALWAWWGHMWPNHI
jgi:hypothetical protein